MKSFVLTLSFLLSFYCYSQKKVIEYFREGKTQKILKWIDKNPTGMVQTLAFDMERAINNFEGSKSCFIDEASTLELAIIYQNFEIIDRSFDIDALTNNPKILSQALNAAIVKDDLKLINQLIDLGADIHAYCNFCHNRTSLQVALGNNASEAVVELILKDITDEELLHTDCSGMHTLEFLAAYKNTKYLKQLYPKLKDQLFVMDDGRNSAFAQAILNGNLENARFLYNEMIQTQDKDALSKIMIGSQDEGLFNLDFLSKNIGNEELENFYDSAFIELYGETTLVNNRRVEWGDLVFTYDDYLDLYYSDDLFPIKVQNAFDFINDALETDLQVDKYYLKDKGVMPPYEYTFYKNFLSNKHLLELIKNSVSEEQYQVFKEHHFDQFSQLKTSFIPLSVTHLSYESENFFEWTGSEDWKYAEINNLYNELNYVSIYFIYDINELNYLEHYFLNADTLALQFENEKEEVIMLPDYLFTHPVILIKSPGEFSFDSKLKLEQPVTIIAREEVKFTEVPEGMEIKRK